MVWMPGALPSEPAEQVGYVIDLYNRSGPMIWTNFMCLGFHIGTWSTHFTTDWQVLRTRGPNKFAYFTARLATFAALLTGCVLGTYGGVSETAGNVLIKTYCVLLATSIAAVNAVLLLRTLAIWNDRCCVRYLCIAAWLATTTIHMWLELWLLRAAPGPLPGITVVGTRSVRGGYVHIVPYVCSLAFCSVMTALTFGGARRSAPSLGALELLRLQTPKGARSQRGQMLIHRLLSAHLRYNLAVMGLTAAVAILLALPGKRNLQCVPLPIFVVCTSAVACNMVLHTLRGRQVVHYEQTMPGPAAPQRHGLSRHDSPDSKSSGEASHKHELDVCSLERQDSQQTFEIIESREAHVHCRTCCCAFEPLTLPPPLTSLQRRPVDFITRQRGFDDIQTLPELSLDHSPGSLPEGVLDAPTSPQLSVRVLREVTTSVERCDVTTSVQRRVRHSTD